MKRYRFVVAVCVDSEVEVEAESYEEAKEMAEEEAISGNGRLDWDNANAQCSCMADGCEPEDIEDEEEG